MQKGKISIVRQYDSTRDTPRIAISITDEVSRTQFLEVYIEPEIFGLLVCGESYKDCEFELNAENVGKTHEHKRESIILPDAHYKITKETAIEYLKKFKSDGWIPSLYDFMNSKNVNYHNGTITIGFDRYV